MLRCPCPQIRIPDHHRTLHGVIATRENEPHIHRIAVPDEIAVCRNLNSTCHDCPNGSGPAWKSRKFVRSRISDILSCRVVWKYTGMSYQKELTIGATIARKAGDLALKIREGNLGLKTSPTNPPSPLPIKPAKSSSSKSSPRPFRKTDCSAKKAPRANRPTAAAGSSTPSMAPAISSAAPAPGACSSDSNSTASSSPASPTSPPPETDVLGRPR